MACWNGFAHQMKVQRKFSNLNSICTWTRYCLAQSDAETNAIQRLLSIVLEWTEKKILETKRQANGLRIAKKIPVFACQWQFLSHFRSSFDWIDIDFYFTTSIFHTHSALVMIRRWCDDHCCSWHSCSWCTSRSSNYHKNKNGSHFIYVLFSI